MNIYLQIWFVLFIALLATVTGILWTLYAFDTVNIGWGQPLMVTILLSVKVWGYCLIQASSPSDAAILKARLEFKQAELARTHIRKVNTAISTVPPFPKSY